MLYLRVIGGTNFSFIVMKGIYFGSFLFSRLSLTHEICENKNPAKISTYTVVDCGGSPSPESVTSVNSQGVRHSLERTQSVIIVFSRESCWKFCRVQTIDVTHW